MSQTETTKRLVKPKLRSGYVFREGDLGPYCPVCGSSQKWKRFLWIFRVRPIGCLHERCERYYRRKAHKGA